MREELQYKAEDIELQILDGEQQFVPPISDTPQEESCQTLPHDVEHLRLRNESGSLPTKSSETLATKGFGAHFLQPTYPPAMSLNLTNENEVNKVTTIFTAPNCLTLLSNSNVWSFINNPMYSSSSTVYSSQSCISYPYSSQ